jgi:hypothetical protein
VFAHQTHDFDLGFGPAVSPVGDNGFGDRLFWTTAIPDGDVQVNFAAGKAELRVDNLPLPDYPRIPVALGPQWQTAFVPGVVSFDVVWNGPVTRRVNVQDGSNGNQFAGEFVENDATVTWSGSDPTTGFSFRSNPGNLSTSIPAASFVGLGHERNGTFFQPDPTAAPPAGSDASSAQGPALATLMLPGVGPALQPTWLAPAPAGTALVPGDGQSPFVSGPLQPLPTGGLTNSPAGNSAGDTTTAASPTGGRELVVAADPVAASDALFTEAGRPGADVFSR